MSQFSDEDEPMENSEYVINGHRVEIAFSESFVDSFRTFLDRQFDVSAQSEQVAGFLEDLLRFLRDNVGEFLTIEKVNFFLCFGTSQSF